MIFALMFCGCGTMTRQESITPKITWSSPEEMVANYHLVVEGKTTLSELKKLGFDYSKVSNAKTIENPSKIRKVIANEKIPIGYLTEPELACLNAMEKRAALDFEIKITSEKSEGGIVSENLGFKKKRRETGQTVHAWFCYDSESEIVLYKTIEHGPIDNLKKSSDPLPNWLFFIFVPLAL